MDSWSRRSKTDVNPDTSDTKCAKSDPFDKKDRSARSTTDQFASERRLRAIFPVTFQTENSNKHVQIQRTWDDARWCARVVPLSTGGFQRHRWTARCRMRIAPVGAGGSRDALAEGVAAAAVAAAAADKAGPEAAAGASDTPDTAPALLRPRHCKMF